MGKTARTLTNRPRALTPTNPTRRPGAFGGPGRGRGRIAARREAIYHRARAATAAAVSVTIAVAAPGAGGTGGVAGNGEEALDELRTLLREPPTPVARRRRTRARADDAPRNRPKHPPVVVV